MIKIVREEHSNFVDFTSEIRKQLYSKRSKDGWKKLRNVAIFDMIGKKEAKIIINCRDTLTNKNLVSKQMNNALIQHFQKTHEQPDAELENVDFPELPVQSETKF